LAAEFSILAEDVKKLYTGAVSDVMNSMGYRAAIDPNIRPIFSDIKVVGKAMTIKMGPVRKGDRNLAEEAKAAAKKGDFVVIDTGENWLQTPWGDNSTTAVRMRGAVAVVTDGACRDIAEHVRIRFPVYCRMISPGVARGVLTTHAYNVPVTCGGVRVEPGDTVFGDDDGLVVIPKAIAQDVFKKTLSFIESDQKVKELLLAGTSVQEAYAAKKGTLG
jgi:regulator of RNase E activity RraA